MTLANDRDNDAHTATLGGRVADALRRHDAGDDAAMTDLVRCVTPWLLHVCQDYRLSVHSAQDVVQTTLLTLVQRGHTLRDPRGGLSWLTVVTRREAMRVATRERRSEPVGDLGDAQALDEVQLSQRFHRSRRWRVPGRSAGPAGRSCPSPGPHPIEHG